MKKSELKALINEVIQEMDQSDPQRAAALSDREHRRAQKLVGRTIKTIKIYQNDGSLEITFTDGTSTFYGEDGETWGFDV